MTLATAANNGQGLQFSNTSSGNFTITTLSETGTGATGILSFSDSGSGSLTLTGTGTNAATQTNITISNTGTGTVTVGGSTSTPLVDPATSIVGTGSGAEVLRITDAAGTAVTSNFSGTTGAVTEVMTRTTLTQADVYSFGTGLTNFTLSNTVALTGGATITSPNNIANQFTLQSTHTTAADAFTFTNASGTASATTFATITNAVMGLDTIKFQVSGTTQTISSVTAASLGSFASVQAGITNALQTLTNQTAGWFTVNQSNGSVNSYIFDHQSTSTTALAAADNLVAVVGTITNFAVTGVNGIAI